VLLSAHIDDEETSSYRVHKYGDVNYNNYSDINADVIDERNESIQRIIDNFNVKVEEYRRRNKQREDTKSTVNSNKRKIENILSDESNIIKKLRPDL
jgi:hypothetical protein